MNIDFRILNLYLRHPEGMPDIFEENLTVRKYATLAMYIFNDFGIDNWHQLDMVGKYEAIKNSGILLFEDRYNFIQFKKGDLSKYFFNVDATIVFNNQRRNLFFENANFRTYTFSQNRWIVCDENIFNQRILNDNVQFDNLYKIIENDTNKTSYLLFIDNNYDGDIDINIFVQEKVNQSFNLLNTKLGTHGINKLSMGFTFMENYEHDNIALPIFVNIVKQFLLDNEYTNSIMLIDEDDSFLNYFNEIQNYTFT